MPWTDGDSHAEVINTKDLCCGYGGKILLKDVTIAIQRSHIVCVLGRSGGGKSTLLRTLLGLEPPIRGQIRFEGRDTKDLAPAEQTKLRRRIGVLFQSAALFNSMTLLENTAFPLIECGGLREGLAEEIALSKLGQVGLSAFAHYLPSAVSGGMRKRCGIARALALDPPFLFLDEPSAGLDPVTAADLDRLILRIRDELGTTMLVVTHELASIRTIADDIAMIDHGEVFAFGPREDVEKRTEPALRSFFDRRPPDEASQEKGGLGELLLP